MLDDLLSALGDLSDFDWSDVIDEVAPDELRELCKYRGLIELLLALCRRL